jgi:hypothetical protein
MEDQNIHCTDHHGTLFGTSCEQRNLSGFTSTSLWRDISGNVTLFLRNRNLHLLHIRLFAESWLGHQSNPGSRRNSASIRPRSEVSHRESARNDNAWTYSCERTIDFLRVSRTAVDDTINQNLNALITPGATPFDPSSTQERQSRPIGRRPIDAQACAEFKDRVLFPSWQSRSDVLNYCAGVATSPDPNDPDHVLRQVEDTRARERIVNERLDPYSARYFPREARTEALASLIRNERMVEGIVRNRTWQLMGERCEIEAESSEKALDSWRSRIAEQ